MSNVAASVRDVSPGRAVDALASGPGGERLRDGAVAVSFLAIVIPISMLLEGTAEPWTIDIIASLVLLALPAAYAWRRGLLTPLSPEIILPLGHYLATLHAPTMRLVFNGRGIDTIEAKVIHTCLYASLAVSTVLLANVVFFGRASRRPLAGGAPALELPVARFEALMGVLASAVGLVLFAAWIATVGAEAFNKADYGEVYLLAQSHTTFTFAWPCIVVGLATTSRALARWPGKPSTTFRILNFVFLACFIGTSARLGMRGPIFEALVAIAFVRAETPRPIRGLVAFLVGVGFIGLFLLISTVRQDLAAGFSTTTDKFSQTVEATTDVEAPSEFDNIFANHVDMVRVAGVTLPHLEGESYLDIPLQLVPRQLVTEKPPILSAWWIRYLDADAADRGAGRAFGSFTEGYLNFGEPGAIAQIAFTTILLLLVYPLLGSKRIGFAAVGGVTLAHAYHAHRSELIHSLFTFRNFLLVALAMLLVRLIVSSIGDASRPLTERA